MEAASIGIIGGADGPTSIFLASKLAPHLLGSNSFRSIFIYGIGACYSTTYYEIANH
jgi:Na+-transporting methylmalonyl-CoA/oxaloacetate decarboxylase beta subunit